MDTQCPKCSHVFHAEPYVVPTLHMAVPDPDHPGVPDHPACNGRGEHFTLTERPDHVTCSRCRATGSYLAALQAWLVGFELPEGYDA